MSTKKPLVFETAFATFKASAVVGEGGSGRVFKATDESGKEFAIKLLDPSKATSEKLRRFKNEFLFCANNCNDNLISVIDCGLFKDAKKTSPFYVMPFYEKSLRNLMKEGIAEDKRLVYFSQILNGVEAAHLKKVVHRDLKPENILYDQTKDRLLVADFGIARFEQDDIYTTVETAPSTRLANFQYAAPEQRTRGSEVDQRADIFSLALILNEMFTREIPQGTSYKTIDNIAPGYSYLDDLVAEMLRQTPLERPASIESIKKQLIGRKNEFISLQRLSELQNAVIPASDIDDPLITDPLKIVSIDWNKDMLTLFFQKPITQKWEIAFRNISGHRFAYDMMPDHFSFRDNRAFIEVGERNAQRAIDHFKDWLQIANRYYEQIIRSERRDAEKRQRQQLEREVAEEDQRQRVLKNIRS